jgi:hypothetical protein
MRLPVQTYQYNNKWGPTGRCCDYDLVKQLRVGVNGMDHVGSPNQYDRGT